jgi:hypothetical protein
MAHRHELRVLNVCVDAEYRRQRRDDFADALLDQRARFQRFRADT